LNGEILVNNKKGIDMKKIALLFTIVCAGQLYGMEQPERGYYTGIAELSPEIQVMIIQALNTYDSKLTPEENITKIVNAIKALSITNKQLHAVLSDMYGDLKSFTLLVGTLAEKFPSISKEGIAKEFNTPMAKKYINLGHELLNFAELGNKNTEISKLIKESGADVNFNGLYVNVFAEATTIGSPLSVAVENLNVSTVEVLLALGAHPTDKDIMKAERLSKLSPERLKRRKQGLRGTEADDIYELLLEAKIKLIDKKLVKAQRRK
jgi:hypothetical protein